ncbi:MAG: hypothetical protein AAF383_06990 [Cyanobacteria bacterium P01_A01_bin.83]
MVVLNFPNFPSELTGKTFNELSEKETGFFTGDEYLPLPNDHALQIIILDRESLAMVKSLAMSRFNEYLVYGCNSFSYVQKKPLHDKWNSELGIQEVRQWLYDLGIPFSQKVFLLYSDNMIVTSWKILVKYWDAFAWSVGVAMYAFDTSMNWICEFHHEDVITYSTFN